MKLPWVIFLVHFVVTFQTRGAIAEPTNNTIDNFSELYEQHYNAVMKHDVKGLTEESGIIEKLIQKIKDKLNTGTTQNSMNATEVIYYKDLLVKLIGEMNDIRHELKQKTDEQSVTPSQRAHKGLRCFKSLHPVTQEIVQDLLNGNVEGSIGIGQNRSLAIGEHRQEQLSKSIHVNTKPRKSFERKVPTENKKIEHGNLNSSLQNYNSRKPRRQIYHKKIKELRAEPKRQDGEIEDRTEKHVPKWKQSFRSLRKSFRARGISRRTSNHCSDDYGYKKARQNCVRTDKRRQKAWRESDQRHDGFDNNKLIGSNIDANEMDAFSESNGLIGITEKLDSQNNDRQDVENSGISHTSGNNRGTIQQHKDSYRQSEKNSNQSIQKGYPNRSKDEFHSKNTKDDDQTLDKVIDNDNKTLENYEKAVGFNDDQTQRTDDADIKDLNRDADIRTYPDAQKTDGKEKIGQTVNQEYNVLEMVTKTEKQLMEKHKQIYRVGSNNTDLDDGVESEDYEENDEVDKPKDFLNHVVSLFHPPTNLLRNEAVLSRSPCDPAAGIGVSILCLVSFVSILSLVLSITNFFLNDARAKNIFSFHSKT